MRIAYITAGAAGTICGNCLKDNALAAALIEAGQDVLLLPAYTPIRTDEADVSDRRVVFGGVNMYLQARRPFLRRSGLFDRILDHPGLLAWVSQFGVDTQPEKLGAMTLATMQGEAGPHAREMGKLIAVLRDFRPDVVHLTNSMFVCMAGPVRRELSAPVVCSLQGEDYFLAHLPEPYRGRCFELLRRCAADVDLFLAPCRDHAAALAPRLGIGAEEIPAVMPGIALDGFRAGAARAGRSSSSATWRGSRKRRACTCWPLQWPSCARRMPARRFGCAWPAGAGRRKPAIWSGLRAACRWKIWATSNVQKKSSFWRRSTLSRYRRPTAHPRGFT